MSYLPTTLSLSNSKTLSANNTTAAVPIFRITGLVYVTKLYGIVTTTLGANHTAAAFRLNDQTAQVDITLNTGTTLSGFAAGTFIGKTAINTSAITAKSATAGKIGEAGTANQPFFQEFEAQAKPAANTDIEYRYTTTDTPTSGVIQFFVEYVPLSADGLITAL